MRAIPPSEYADGPSTRLNQSAPVAVDPGDIRAFARFLEEMGRRVGQVEQGLARSHEQPVDFGAHYASSEAGRAHAQAVAATYANVRALRARITELTEGTVQLAKRYADTEELNRALAADVTAALAHKEA